MLRKNFTRFFLRHFIYEVSFFVEKVTQVLIVGNTIQLIGHNLFGLVLDADIVVHDHLVHVVVTMLVTEVGDDGYGLVGFGLLGNLCVVHNDFRMEDFLIDAFVEVV